jgi:hypothetical protein
MALIYEHKVPINRSAFISKVKRISVWLGIDPNWLMACMHFETAGTMSPSITNSVGATGLIQFMPSTALGLGTTTALLREMSNVDQLDWVYKYLKPHASKISSFVDLYLAIFFPAAMGKPSDYVLQTKSLSASRIASQNPAFDLNKDRKITKAEVEIEMLSRFPKEYQNELKKKV